MWHVLSAWAIGVAIVAICLTALTNLFGEVCELALPERFEWITDMIDKLFGTITTSIFFSLPICMSVGLVYGCYRLGDVVLESLS